MVTTRTTSLLKNTAIFAVGNLGSKLLVLLLLPFCTYFIDPTGMGIYDILYTVVELLKPIAILAIPEALFRWLLDKSSDSKLIVSSWIRLFILLCSIFTILYLIAWALFRFDDALIIYALVVTGCVYMGLQFATRGFRNNKLFALQGIVYSFILCVVSVVLVVALNYGYYGLLFGVLAGNCASIILMISAQLRDLKFDPKCKSISIQAEMLSYSAMLLPNTLSWWFVTSFGRFVILAMLGPAANGIYAIASKFPTAINMVSTIFIQAWSEHAVSEFDSEDRDSYFSNIFRAYSKLVFSLVIILIPLTKVFIILFLESSYASAGDYAGLLYLAAAFSAMSSFFGTGYFCYKDTRGAATTTVYGALVNCALCLVLVPFVGIQGVTIALAFGQLTIWLIRVRQQKEYLSIEMHKLELVINVSLATMVALVIQFLNLPLTVGLAIVSLLYFCFVNRSTFLSFSKSSRSK